MQDKVSSAVVRKDNTECANRKFIHVYVFVLHRALWQLTWTQQSLAAFVSCGGGWFLW
jgi:hypothetical protein